MCAHCGNTGHTIDKCFKMHGYSPSYKSKGIILLLTLHIRLLFKIQMMKLLFQYLPISTSNFQLCWPLILLRTIQCHMQQMSILMQLSQVLCCLHTVLFCIPQLIGLQILVLHVIQHIILHLSIAYHLFLVYLLLCQIRFVFLCILQALLSSIQNLCQKMFSMCLVSM